MKSAILALMLALFPHVALAAASDNHVWNVKVDAFVGKSRLQYTVRAWVYSPGPNYKAALYAIGPYAASPNLPLVSRLDQIVDKEPGAVVFDAGFWSDGPFQPAGLLLLKGRTVHQFSFAKKKNGDYRLSAVLCLNAEGEIKPLKTADFESSDASVRGMCNSAVQAGPIVVEDGKNAIGSDEGNSRPSVRTMLGFDDSGIPTVVIFQDPVQLRVASEFLRGPKRGDRSAMVANSKSGGGLISSGGLGLKDVVNLDGDMGAAGFYEGQTIIGSPTMAIPSAFALRPN